MENSAQPNSTGTSSQWRRW